MTEGQLDALIVEISAEVEGKLTEEQRLVQASKDAEAAGRVDEAQELDRKFWVASGQNEGMHHVLNMLLAARKAAQ